MHRKLIEASKTTREDNDLTNGCQTANFISLTG